MRISKVEYYLNIARAVAKRSTCLRRQYGAVIVKNDEIISTGYNGSHRGADNCCDVGVCWREAHGIPHGEQYEKCESPVIIDDYDRNSKECKELLKCSSDIVRDEALELVCVVCDAVHQLAGGPL